ncbi:MAG: DUF1156 domain-containing protein, partial [Anaerolineae bacterium]|nr:DUF1156 domain-containing protein [Anaerolineae bacterium]
MTYRKKLIEVALPLEAINEASAREKSIRHGHPSTLHLWWARRPLAACRAVIFASLVDDPNDPDAPPAYVQACRKLPRGKNAAENDTPRQRLFDFIERLVLWESTTDEQVLETARELIRLATDGNPPPLLDPFAGGGSIPLEAQRLGLEAHASDLNPVAVMINKALIEIPPKFTNQPPVNPRDREKAGGGASWKGASGLAADVRYYGEWMRDQAWERIGHLYPECNGETVIAWLWARTVKCPNPACGAEVPLTRSYNLSTRRGSEAWLEPIVDTAKKKLVLKAHTGPPPKSYKTIVKNGTKQSRGANFFCPVCENPIPREHIRTTGENHKFGAQLMGVVTEGNHGRNYYSPDQIKKISIEKPEQAHSIAQALADDPRAITVKLYGYETFDQLFSNRQLTALFTFADLISEVRKMISVERDVEYANAVATYLAFALDKATNYWSTLCGWHFSREIIMSTLGRQALPMIWDYAETNPFSDSTGKWLSGVEQAANAIERVPQNVKTGIASQADATAIPSDVNGLVISTDPPYYDNVPYSDVSDFFYVWLRYSLKNIYPELFGTLLTPKTPEIVAFSYRFDGNQKAADQHFETQLGKTFHLLAEKSASEYPLTVYYAFKQQEMVVAEGTASTGWEKMLEGLAQDFQITGTWPMRTEQSGGLRLVGRNSLASSIVLVCRPRPDDAPITSRRDLVNLLRRELPAALRDMQSGNIAPVDLAQASIGPGMAVYSRYRKVLEPNGDPLTVRTALQLINQVLDEYLAEQEGNLDGASRFAVAWFEQYGFNAGDFGTADVLARAKNTSVETLARAGFLDSGAGKVRLLAWDELDPGRLGARASGPHADGTSAVQVTVWEAVHYLIERLNTHGEEGTAMLLARMPSELAADARQLAYRLYSICERKGWADHARDYNALVVSWGA